ALFGGSDEDVATPDTTAAPVATTRGTLPPTGGYAAGTLPPSSAPAYSAGVGTMAGITPVSIQPGTDTGTAGNKTIQSVRSQVATLESRLAANSQRLADLRSAGAGQASSYHEAKAQITTRLQVGTTRGNPELVAQWNTAQSALDQLSGNIN